MTFKKNILIAPLNWGLGHATRCIPIINNLLLQNFNPIIASDGESLKLLQKEFPNLKTITLPSYNIQYPKKGNLLKWKLLSLTPQILKVIKTEHKIVQKLVDSEKLSGIISDNRFGIRSDKVPSVFITHQLNVLSGITTFITSKLHQKIINKFNECWIPDDKNLKYSGKLSQSSSIRNQKYIGVLSRFKEKEQSIKYDLLVILSGIEPSRTQLEKKLLSELKKFNGTVIFVRGVIEKHQEKKENEDNICYNFLLTNELRTTISQSKLVLARSGYSTIMDLAKLNKKAFFIPITGQYEQEYLAKHLAKLKIAPFATEKNFKIEMLKEVEYFSGFVGNVIDNTTMDFSLFQ